jgi:cob(I)alamin adenosyltransferase
MKLYTKTGDEGLTGLLGGTRIKKNDLRIEAYGTIDELNSFIGFLLNQELLENEKEFLYFIQNQLFIIGSNLATDREKIDLPKVSIVSEDEIRRIEAEIDKLDSQLPELNSFILPGGVTSASISHICRTITRRAERRIVEIGNNYYVDIQIIIFINRLSDYFFVLSRYLNLKAGNKEICWKISE